MAPVTGRTTQRGAALLLAMIILALVATLASAMVWQQFRAIQVETAERARSQSGWILLGASDWARLILREDGGTSDNLSEVWAQPLAEARLSTFLASDKDPTTDDGPQAFLSGGIVDAQSRYNLHNLAVYNDPKAIAAERAVLVNLLDSIGVNGSDIGARILNVMQAAYPVAVPASAAASTGTTGTTTAATGIATTVAPTASYVQPQSVDQLAWFGVDDDSIKRMRPFVTILPATAATQVNVNTAPQEVLAAVAGVPPGTAQQWVLQRKSKPYNAVADALTVAGNLSADQTTFIQSHLTTQSSYFEVRGRLRLDDKVLEEGSLVVRTADRQVGFRQRRRDSLRDSTTNANANASN